MMLSQRHIGGSSQVTVTTMTNNGAYGSASGGGSFKKGAMVTVTASAVTGTDFVNWTENGSVVSTSASYSFPATSNRVLVANFKINLYNGLIYYMKGRYDMISGKNLSTVEASKGVSYVASGGKLGWYNNFVVDGWMRSETPTGSNTQRTLSFWVNFNNSYIRQTIVGNNSVWAFSLYRNINNKMEIMRNTTNINILSNNPLQSGTWNHCIITFGGADTKLYLNGSLDNTINQIIYAFPTQYSGGGWTGSGTSTVQGDFMLGELAMWNRIFDADDVASLYNGGNGKALY